MSGLTDRHPVLFNTPLDCRVAVTHEGLSELDEVALVSHFLREHVGWVQVPGNVHGVNFLVLDCFPDGALPDVELTHVLGHGL